MNKFEIIDVILSCVNFVFLFNNIAAIFTIIKKKQCLLPIYFQLIMIFGILIISICMMALDLWFNGVINFLSVLTWLLIFTLTITYKLESKKTKPQIIISEHV